MSQTRYLCRLKNGRTGCLMMFIRSFTSMPLIISVRDNGVIVKKAAYVILGLTCGRRTEALSLAIGEHESAKFRLNALKMSLECRMLRLSALYGSHGPQHLEIHCIKRYEIFCLRPKDYVQCGFRRGRAECSPAGC